MLQADFPRLARRTLLVSFFASAAGTLLAACQPASPVPPSPLAASPAPAFSPAPASPAPAQAAPSPQTSPSTASPSPSASPLALASQKPELDHVSMSYPTLSGELAYIAIAVDQGFFSKYGVDVDEIYAQSGTALAALIAGQVQFGNADGVLTTTAYAAGSPIRLIANFDRTCPYAIFGSPNIASPADLKGKTIAIGQHGDASDVSARVALKPYGLNVGSDVGVISGGNSPARFAALVTGQVDAAVVDQASFAQQAADRGLPVLVSLRDQGIPWIGGGLSVTQSFGQGSPNTMLAVIKGLLEGIRFFADDTNRDASLAILAKDLQLQPNDPAVAAAYDAYHVRSTDDPDPQQAAIDNVLGALQEIDPSQYGNVDGTQLIDHTPVNQLRASGFLASLAAGS